VGCSSCQSLELRFNDPTLVSVTIFQKIRGSQCENRGQFEDAYAVRNSRGTENPECKAHPMGSRKVPFVPTDPSVPLTTSSVFKGLNPGARPQNQR
jgi:hypothetical protein